LQSEDFKRLRLGIGNGYSDAMTYVLEPFSKKEYDQLNDLLPICTEAIHHWIEHGIEETMNIYNRQYFSENGK